MYRLPQTRSGPLVPGTGSRYSESTRKEGNQQPFQPVVGSKKDNEVNSERIRVRTSIEMLLTRYKSDRHRRYEQRGPLR